MELKPSGPSPEKVFPKYCVAWPPQPVLLVSLLRCWELYHVTFLAFHRNHHHCGVHCRTSHFDWRGGQDLRMLICINQLTDRGTFFLCFYSKESRSLLWKRVTQRVSSRRFFMTTLHFCVSTQTRCYAWRPLKTSSHMVRVLLAAPSSIMYSIGFSGNMS